MVRAGGFSLHAGIDIAPHQRAKLERLCRYVSRPPVATERTALTSSGHIRYQLKTPYRDGTTHLVIEPLDFIARLAALVSPPRMHLGPVSRGVCAAQQERPSRRRTGERAPRSGQPWPQTRASRRRRGTWR
ncbi:MAG: transposase [Burkholderiaceae bacterium]|nr:transposase [Burkholderiaceae bacterium]